MNNSKILTASLAGALILATSTFAYADPPLFNLVPADPPLNGKVDCSEILAPFGFFPKNLGQELTIIKAYNGASFSLRTAFVCEEEFDPDNFDNVGDILKNEMENICNIGPNN